MPTTTPATTVNKVCASGMKAVMQAAQNIQLGIQPAMVAGGMESMTNTPFYVPRDNTFGHQILHDSIIKDGLWDVYGQIHMGSCAENTARRHNITREMQDEHARQSYARAIAAWKNGTFANEVVPVTIKSKKGDTVVNVDEEFTKMDLEKIPKLRAVFEANG
ncbi:hypothetical protein EV182_008224, partial [Spiromyces aspiralis]